MAFSKRKSILCDKCHHSYRECSVRKCPHPAVQRHYGENICVSCCKGCKFAVKTPFCGALGCGYGTGEDDSGRANDLYKT